MLLFSKFKQSKPEIKFSDESRFDRIVGVRVPRVPLPQQPHAPRTFTAFRRGAATAFVCL